MAVGIAVASKLYKDSLSLMRIAEAIATEAGIRRATLVMGTDANKDILAQSRLLGPEAHTAGPNDLVIAVEGETEEVVEAAIATAKRLLLGRGIDGTTEAVAESAPRSLGAGVRRFGPGQLALVSVPGPYAGAEAMKALRLGMDVMIFSDNVPSAQERAIKGLAERKGLLVMGPDCGTAIVNGVPLGFANAVRRGKIGIVAASGTGLQEVSCQIHRLGGGVSQALGTGGRDVSEAIGAMSMLRGLKLLAQDPHTEVIIIVSKPPARSVIGKVTRAAAAAATGKPVVVLFLGAATGAVPDERNLHSVHTLEDAARAAVALSRGERPSSGTVEASPSVAPGLAPSQRYIRALYSGGTFCSEAQAIWREHGIAAYSNAPLDETRAIDGLGPSREHTALDLGADEFTVGRLHPMIDCTLRTERLLQEAADPETAILLLDVVLGHGCHADPAGALAPAIAEARHLAAKAERNLPVIGFVTGTSDDPQDLSRQEAQLREAGMILFASSSAAARAAGRWALAASSALAATAARA